MGQLAAVQDPDLVTLAVARAKEGDTNAHSLPLCPVRRRCLRLCEQTSCTAWTSPGRSTQSVFAKLMTTLQRYEPGEVPFAAWILRVSRNAALDNLVARDDAQLRQVLLRLREGRRLPLPRQTVSLSDRS